uniref:Intron protein 2, putative LAGLIDAGDG endonuclease n=1 Tax=Madurella mycetomatis TaxID=100816 RepID=J3JRF1_9PEZI|nr:intron protein 2, putative LAGLIDAGDG endonuclease [Madurella mycetomatis]AEY94398.1 intron protein 2, putative LAGLIDAGDG endonuclease [Madurella mycetomatis]
MWSGKSLLLIWELTLPNYGELLKLLIPSISRKANCGWINYSGKVKSQEICENKMDNRVSKSIVRLIPAIVKEQRVDGNGLVEYSTSLRCTLSDFERNSNINILSNQVFKRFYSNIIINKSDFINTESPVDPWFFTGFSDGEASFIIYIQKTNNTKIGWASWVAFEINLDGKDLSILKDIKSYLGVGKINQKSNGTCVYYVRALEEIATLIHHFDKYPLKTKKQADYLLFKSAYEIIKNKQHLTEEGFNKILALRASINKGLPAALKEAFPNLNITPSERPIVKNENMPDPNWISGFTTAEGNFLVRILDKPKTQVILRFKLTQHIRDEELFTQLADYLDCGKIYLDERSVSLIVTKFSDLSEKIIPLFDKYPVQGLKRLNYADFVKVWQLMKNNLHLTTEGVKLIRKIKSGMNFSRIFK